VAAYSIENSKKNKLVAAGFFTDGTSFTSIANSNGVFGYQQDTGLDFTLTVRTEDGRGSGWVKRSVGDASKFDARAASDIAIEGTAFGGRQGAGAGPLHGDPGTGRDLRRAGLYVQRLRRAFGRRRPQLPVEERRRQPLGEKLFDEQVNVWADPWDKDVAVLPFDAQSLLARERQDIIKNGKIASLDYSPYWAKKRASAPWARRAISSWPAPASRPKS
jgi:predicted Zn-dependent protease